MLDFLLTPTGRAIIMTAVLAVMILVGWYIVTRFRDFADEGQPTASELMTNFQELHDRGDISDAEFRKLKTVLQEKLQREVLKDDSDTG